MEYFTLITHTGLTAIASALSNNSLINISEMAFGDANNTAYEPTADQSQLVNEKYRVSINSIEPDPYNPNWVVVTAILPADVGDFYIEEVGLYADGGLIAIARYPRTFKPLITHGITREMHISMIIQLDNADVVNMIIDPNIAVATRKYVDDQINQITVQGIKPFDTYADLIAYDDTAPNLAKDQFVARVFADPDIDLNSLYAWVNQTGEWRKIEDQSTTEIYDDLALLRSLIITNSAPFNTVYHDDEGNKFPFAVVDLLQKPIFALNKKIMRWMNLFIEKTNDHQTMFSDKIGRTLFKLNEKGLHIGSYLLSMSKEGLELSDGTGRTSIKLYQDGSVRIPKLKGIEIPEYKKLLPPMLGYQQNKKIKVIFSIGQSLNMGTGGVDALSSSQPYKNVMFSGGVLSQSGHSDYDPSGFVPLVAQPSTVFYNRSEAPVVNATNALTRRIIETFSPQTTYDADDFIFFAQAIGMGGYSIEKLYSNGYVDRLKTQIYDLKKICDQLGYSIEVWSILYIQGEANYAFNTEDGRSFDTFNYMTKQAAMMHDISQHIFDVLEQASLPPVFNYQVGAHINYDPTSLEIAKAHWLITKQLDQFSLFAPVYMMPTLDNDVHLPSVGSWLLGEYAARAMHHQLFLKKGKWRPLEPIDVTWTDSYIDVKFHVPCKPLVIDDALCALTVNSGFDIWDNNIRLTDIVNTVEITADDIVRISLNYTASTSAVLSYARGVPGVDRKAGPIEGARGNLRDSHGNFDVVTLPDGSGDFAMHNACVMFTYNRNTGFH